MSEMSLAHPVDPNLASLLRRAAVVAAERGNWAIHNELVTAARAYLERRSDTDTEEAKAVMLNARIDDILKSDAVEMALAQVTLQRMKMGVGTPSATLAERVLIRLILVAEPPLF